MACLMKVPLASIFVGVFVSVGSGQGKGAISEGDNAEQFALLCRIYNVAKNPPINHVDLTDPYKIVNEMDSINASFAEEKQFNETEHVGNGTDAQLSHTTTLEAAAAQANIMRITQKAHNVLEDIRKLNATRDIENVKAELAHVIFGDGGNETDLGHGALKGVSGRGKACGDTGLSRKGERAGKNLVVDFFCLCAQNTEKNSGIDNVCGFFVGRKSTKFDKHGWDESGLLGSSAMWASIKKGCGKLMQQHPKSTAEVHDILEDFLKHLKSGGVYRNNKKENSYRIVGMLGTSVLSEDSRGGIDPVCDGRKGGKTGSPGGMCVFYGQEAEWQNIPWMMKLKTALSMVNALNNKTATIQRDIEKLQTLLHRAEKIYETAKVISEVQNPVLPTNLQTAAKRLTAYSAARRHHPHTHFMILFVLL
ncbi:Variant surface glycoprotein [Trypanosoma congolense IL3000]|uniref:Variant surface glycoprotein n=1 Tax=Trypanosoma congolense (strain IL3000) TaxID=1068625 RepID=F9WEY3_TRYCI|nr:Variant surface glycoprotein [Trypanosoma congolense IL3000]